MQMINLENFKSFEAIAPQAGMKQIPGQAGCGSFKDVMMKAITGESIAAIPAAFNADAGSGDLLLGELIAMMTGADITEAGMSATPFETAINQDAQCLQDANATVALEYVPHEAALKATGQFVQNAETGSLRSELTHASHEPERAKHEKPLPAQQKTDHASSQKGEPTVKYQAQSEKPVVVKDGENAARNAESKQDAAKEVKHEHAGQAKQETVFTAEKVYVKVGEGNNLNSEKFASDVSDKIFTKMSEGAKQFEIELMPKDLGKILIKLVMMDGKAEILIQCLNPKTQQLVLSSADIIRGIVEERTGTQTTLTVKDDEDKQETLDRDGQQEERGREEQHKDKEWDETESMIFLQQLRLGLTEELNT
jgi:flagellar hook-length control protein FliK